MKINRRALLRSGCLSIFSAVQRPGFAQESQQAAAATYAEKLAAYEAARTQFEELAKPYWQSISDKRRLRTAKRRAGQPVLLDDYVVTQPPVYTGPAKPVDPEKPPAPEQPSKPIPVVADFLKHAREQFGFAPDRPRREIEFKRVYALTARRAGLTRAQIVRIYGFEAGGNGNYDVQAGLEHPGPNARAISTALGYNQLLTTNSVELLADSGDKFMAGLKARAAILKGKPKTKLEDKIRIVELMIAFSRSVPDDWSEHEKLAATPKGIGIHALNLDLDVGPLLQTQKLLDSVVFAKQRGYGKDLTAAELEMMNLTGDGNGFDMIMMPPELRDRVPTSNFFQRGGYERNPVAARNPTVAKLIAATDAVMDRESVLPGAKELASAYDRAIRQKS